MTIAKIYNARKNTGFKHQLCIYKSETNKEVIWNEFFVKKVDAKKRAKKMGALAYNY